LAEEYPQTNPGGKPRKETNDNRGCVRGLVIGVIGCAGLLVVIVGAFVLIGGATLSGVGDSVRAVVDRIFPAPSATVDVSSSVVTNVQLLSDVVTLRTQLVKSRVAVNLSQGVVGACSFTALHIAEGDFEAGIDLSQITREDIVYNEETNSYLLSLPQPYLRSCYVRVERYSDNRSALCGEDWTQVTNLAEYVAMQEFLNDISGGDMYAVARRNAEIVIGTFVENLLGTETEIQFSNQPRRAEDATCRSQAPAGWTQDDNRVWTRR
jgi:hypothetical protein